MGDQKGPPRSAQNALRVDAQSEKELLRQHGSPHFGEKRSPRPAAESSCFSDLVGQKVSTAAQKDQEARDVHASTQVGAIEQESDDDSDGFDLWPCAGKT